MWLHRPGPNIHGYVSLLVCRECSRRLCRYCIFLLVALNQCAVQYVNYRDRQMDRWIDRQIDRQIDVYAYVYLLLCMQRVQPQTVQKLYLYCVDSRTFQSCCAPKHCQRTKYLNIEQHQFINSHFFLLSMLKS